MGLDEMAIEPANSNKKIRLNLDKVVKTPFLVRKPEHKTQTMTQFESKALSIQGDAQPIIQLKLPQK